MVTFTGSYDELKNIIPGQRITYHVGCLANDKIDNYAVSSIAKLAMELEQQGKVMLFAARIRGVLEKFEYIAIGRRYPKSPRKIVNRPRPRYHSNEYKVDRKLERDVLDNFIISEGIEPRPFPDRIKIGKFLTTEAKLYIIEQVRRFNKSERTVAAILGTSPAHVYRIVTNYDAREIERKRVQRVASPPFIKAEPEPVV